mmetsp:Transcript_14281/g.33250  ORF Transcript_14281/g.33250 Transcript_14281/m.33250 type:complete len:178 (+) Transcript_14281:927-1460(+)
MMGLVLSKGREERGRMDVFAWNDDARLPSRRCAMTKSHPHRPGRKPLPKDFIGDPNETGERIFPEAHRPEDAGLGSRNEERFDDDATRCDPPTRVVIVVVDCCATRKTQYTRRATPRSASRYRAGFPPFSLRIFFSDAGVHPDDDDERENDRSGRPASDPRSVRTRREKRRAAVHHH